MPLDTVEQLNRSAGHGRGAIISNSRSQAQNARFLLTRAPASYRSSRSSCEIEDVTPASDTTSSQSMAESSALSTASFALQARRICNSALQVPGHEQSARA